MLVRLKQKPPERINYISQECTEEIKKNLNFKKIQNQFYIRNTSYIPTPIFQNPQNLFLPHI